VPVATLLDSFAIGGVYTILPLSGYPRNAQTIPYAPPIFVYTRLPEGAVYANPISRHPTGIELPAGLPVRVLAEGRVESTPTSLFLGGYCLRPGVSDPYCSIGSFWYSIHGLEPAPWVLTPYLAGSGLKVHWSRLGPQTFGIYPSPEFFRGPVPSNGASSATELHFSRTAGCCFRIPYGDAVYGAWESYSGRWRFGVVVDDGGRAEFGEPSLLRLNGPRTDWPMAAPADFTLHAVDGTAVTDLAWWFIESVNNVFDGVLPDSTVFESAFNVIMPTYGATRRSRVSAIATCAGMATCRYQALGVGAVVAKGTLADGRVLAARNIGTSAIITEVTMVGGDSIVPSGTRVSNIRPVTRVVEVSVRTADGAPVSGREVTLRAVSDSLQSGGHSHQQQPGLLRMRPTGRFATGAETTAVTTVTTGADGRARTTYVAPVVGGTEVLWAASAGSDSVHRRLVLAVPRIVAVADTSVHYFMERTRNHSPGHNYAHVGVMEKVDSLLARYKALHLGNPVRFPFEGANGARFRVSAVGLPRGGLYDVNGQWTPVPDGHQWHREGLEVDLNDRGNGQGAESARGQDAMFALCRTDVAASQYRPRKCIYHLGHYHITYPGVFR
jgi:hypothetical protein